jgi:hypothetical protein
MAPATTTAVPQMRQNAPTLNQDMTAQVLALQTSIYKVFAMVSKSLDASAKALSSMRRTQQLTKVHAHLLHLGLIVLETDSLTLMKIKSVINQKRYDVSKQRQLPENSGLAGVCDEFEIMGCTDVMAQNYDANAKDDAENCVLQLRSAPILWHSIMMMKLQLTMGRSSGIASVAWMKIHRTTILEQR